RQGHTRTLRREPRRPGSGGACLAAQWLAVPARRTLDVAGSGMEQRRPVSGGAAAVEAEGLVETYSGRAGAGEAGRGGRRGGAAGEVFGFLGPNGAGKSTTVKMLTTLLTITAGRARVAGLDVARQADGVRRRIGVALQEAGLDPRQTGRELLVLQGRLFDLSA